MQTETLSYAGYWRNSLVDADTGSGAFRIADSRAFLTLSKEELDAGIVGQTIIDTCFAKEPEQVKHVEVVIRPWVHLRGLEHGSQRENGAPDIVTPVVASALLARDGRLYPQAGTFVPRNVLEPLERGSFSIGQVADQDAFLTTRSVPEIAPPEAEDARLDESEFSRQWKNFLAGCAQLLEHVSPGWPDHQAGYQQAGYGYLLKKESLFASQHIVALYDHIRENAPNAPLFERYACTWITPPEPCLPAHAAFTSRLAHASDRFPLAPAQRDALAHLMRAGKGEILAVNGPPGTGKTTLLLSVVASLWAQAALAGAEPPVILAASTNNQAVTNIIDAFGKDFATGDGPFSGRWLPRIASFGAYFPSASKEAEASEKYQTRGFFESVESETYVAEARATYLAAAAAAFPELDGSTLDVATTVDTLRAALQDEAKKLGDLNTAWENRCAARAAVQAELGDAPSTEMAQRLERLQSSTEARQAADRLAGQWEHYLARESLLYTLLAWLPPVSKKRVRLARLFLKPVWPVDSLSDIPETIDQIEAIIKSAARQARQELEARTHQVKRGRTVLEAEKAGQALWQTTSSCLGAPDLSDDLSMAECDTLADTLIRFRIFLLTTHYWEGRWLLDMEDLLPEIDKERRKTGRATLEKRWRRRMKLTPCIVSTFFMLPKEMRASRYNGQGFSPDYLYDFADLLIVDEAGQVLPEVAGAAFALCQKALVIGDTMQIEPIWSIPRRLDIGNLLSAGLLPGEDYEAAYDQLETIGKSASSGSVMRIAQALTRYHQDPDLARGLFLYEHRRCFDEIIHYCNALCYRGKLIPKRGAKQDAATPGDGLPALGYLHIDGICQPGNGGSRYNAHEARVIAAWLERNRTSLEATYGQPLHQIVGVVTPFAGQVRAISAACRHVGIGVGADKEGMTVGTVHSLQGAERPIVIFSPTYTKHGDGGFIDASPSLLNVAVSRAKNAFLVFGDMDVFESIPRTQPRGLLAKELFRNPANALHFEYQVREDLRATGSEIRPLRDAREHDAFLLDALANVKHEIQIVSPWVILDRIREVGAFDAMRAATRRGVKVMIYTDPELNAGEALEKLQTLLSTADALRDVGIEVGFVGRVHSKILIGDDNLYCVGSFNWFSARRDAQYARHETSLAYLGPELAPEIEAMKSSLRTRLIEVPTIP